MREEQISVILSDATVPCAVPHATPIMAKFFNISHLVEKRRQETRGEEKIG
jgi:Skp family chaperone for outer membrane proteins